MATSLYLIYIFYKYYNTYKVQLRVMNRWRQVTRDLDQLDHLLRILRTMKVTKSHCHHLMYLRRVLGSHISLVRKQRHRQRGVSQWSTICFMILSYQIPCQPGGTCSSDKLKILFRPWGRLYFLQVQLLQVLK